MPIQSHLYSAACIVPRSNLSPPLSLDIAKLKRGLLTSMKCYGRGCLREVRGADRAWLSRAEQRGCSYKTEPRRAGARARRCTRSPGSLVLALAEAGVDADCPLRRCEMKWDNAVSRGGATGPFLPIARSPELLRVRSRYSDAPAQWWEPMQ